MPIKQPDQTTSSSVPPSQPTMTPAATRAQEPGAYIKAIISLIIGGSIIGSLLIGSLTLFSGLFVLFSGLLAIMGLTLGGHSGLTGYWLKSKQLMILGYTGLGLNSIVLFIEIIKQYLAHN